MTKSKTMQYELTDKKEEALKKKAIMKHTNDIDKLDSIEVLQRLYTRHSTGLWQAITAAVVTLWVVSIW